MNASVRLLQVCRFCLNSVEKQKSFPVDAVEERSGISYREFLHRWDSDGRMNHDLEEHLPQRVCRTCQRKVDDILHFQAETISNTQMLIAIAEAKQYGSLTTLENQLKSGLCRSGLHRLNLIKQVDATAEEIMQELRRNLLPACGINIKTETSDTAEDDALNEPMEYTEETVLDENCDLQLKFEVGEESYESPEKIAEVNTKKRPCIVQGCEPVIGRGLQHAKTKHRTYCKICGQVFGKHSHALYHVAIHKPKEERLRCSMCNKTFCRDYTLKVHLLESHGQTTASFECALCEQVFETKADLAKHREIHLASPCQFCDRRNPFGSYKRLLEHFRLAHKKQIFKCEHCAGSFLGRRELETHKEKHRDGTFDNCVEFALRSWNESFRCSVCERSFYNEEYLNRHREKVHKVYPLRVPEPKTSVTELDYKFKCKECDARYRLKSSLKGHVYKNHRTERKVCNHCGASFKSNNELDCHVRYVHTKDFRFKCEFCDKRCNTSSDLKVHRRTHTNERPYKCSYEGCYKDYKTHGAMKKHVRSVHTLERPYKCTYEACGRGFVCSELLKKHVLSHTKENPFKCGYCELRFNQNYSLRGHIRKHHPGQPDEVPADGEVRCEKDCLNHFIVASQTTSTICF
ncbi:zinc finger protein 888 [Aedes albopictus]|uniref:C2h2-type zn-finger protein n=1 Tax=Aedes albopictus TaxID=7160 RepID=A0ABM1YX75_AEDAL